MGLSLTKFYAKKELCIVMAGIFAAGKTAIFNKFTGGEIDTTIPTIGTMEYNNIKITLIDLAWRDAHWILSSRCYFPTIQGVSFVVDSSDRNYIDEERAELFRLMNEDRLKDAVLLVLANKQDLPNSMSNKEVMDMIGLTSLKQHHWCVQGSNAVSAEGMYEGLDWLCRNIALRGK